MLLTVSFCVADQPNLNQDLAVLLTNGDSIARATFETIEAAQEDIYSVEFLMRDDEFGKMKLALLRKKAREGVKVFIHVDALHLKVKPELVQHLIQEGIRFKVFNDFKWSKMLSIDRRDHSKLLVADGKIMKTGDTNTGNEYVAWGLGHIMQSRDVFVVGRAAAKAKRYAQRMFRNVLSTAPKIRLATDHEIEEQNIKTEKKKEFIYRLIKGRINLDAPELLAKPEIALVSERDVNQASADLDQVLFDYEKLKIEKGWTQPLDWTAGGHRVHNATFHHDPFERKGSDPGMDRAVVEFMKGAKESLVIVSPYLLPTSEDKNVLETLLKNGVSVSMYTNSIYTSDNKFTQEAYELNVRALTKLGKLDLFEYNSVETWHAKILIRDGKEMMIMGYNVDGRSKKINLETGFFAKSKPYVKEMLENLDQNKSSFIQVIDKGTLTPNKLSQLKTRESSCGRFYRGASRVRDLLLRIFEFKL